MLVSDFLFIPCALFILADMHELGLCLELHEKTCLRDLIPYCTQGEPLVLVVTVLAQFSFVDT